MELGSSNLILSRGMYIVFLAIACLATSMVMAASTVQLSASKSITIVTSSSNVSAARKQRPRLATNHILVELKSTAAEARFLNAARRMGLRKIRTIRGTNWLSMEINSPGNEPRKVADSVRGLAGVLRAAADPILSINDQIPPRDPYYLDDPDPGSDCDIIEDSSCQAEDLVDQWNLFKVMSESGWLESTGSPDVVIAVTDSGIDLDHDDLWGNIWNNQDEIAGNGIDDDGNGFVDDTNGWDFSGDNVGGPSDDPASEDNNPDITAGGQWIYDPLAIPLGYRYVGDTAVGDGIDNNLEYYPLLFTIDIGVFHGTTVAGIIAAMTDNFNLLSSQYEGFAGACWHCKLMPLRIINAEGDAFGSDAAEAIYYAVDNGAHIINASWGIPPGAATQDELAVLQQAIEYAFNNGVLVVSAAGNGGDAGLYFPASMPETIAVGSSNWLDARSDFSTYANPANQDILDVVAPGEAIWNAGVLSAYDAWVMNDWLLFPEFDWEPRHPGDGVYVGGDGTSFAAPLVSGYLGVILSRNPCATPSQVRDILRNNAVDIGTPGYDVYTGYGRISMVVPDLGCTAPIGQPPTADFNYIIDNLDVVFTDQSIDADGNIVSWQWDFGDGGNSTEQNPAHSYIAGSYTVTLTVTDNDGQLDSESKTISVSTEPSINEPPVAMFTYLCTGLTCDFDASSSSDDTALSDHAWSLGDGFLATGQVAQHTYASQGRYSVMLTVTDSDNTTAEVSSSIRIKNRGTTSGSATSAGNDSDGGDSTTLEVEKGKRKCNDSVDNDGDGLIDGDDPDCR